MKTRQRRNRADPDKLESEVDLLRGILKSLQFNNGLHIMHLQYLLLQSTERSASVKREKMRSLMQTMDVFLDEYTEEEVK